MGTERVVEISKKFIDILNTIEFKGFETLTEIKLDGRDIFINRCEAYSSVSVGSNYKYTDFKSSQQIFYDLNADLDEIAELLENFYKEKLPNFSEDYHKKTLRAELEQLEARKKSIESLLDEKE